MTIRETHAVVMEMVPLTDTIIQLILSPESYIDYQAGQYLQLVVGNVPLCYSIANAPLGARHYELHIRHSRDKPADQSLLEEIKRQGMVTLRAPFGQCDFAHIHPTKPILFIAAGTGFAQVKAIIEQLLATGDMRRFELIWSVRTQSDFYLDEKVLQWQNHIQQFKYRPLLSERNTKTAASLVISSHAHDLNEWQIVMSGPFDMVYSTRDKLVDHGVSLESLYSDAFQFEEKLKNEQTKK